MEPEKRVEASRVERSRRTAGALLRVLIAASLSLVVALFQGTVNTGCTDSSSGEAPPPNGATPPDNTGNGGTPHPDGATVFRRALAGQADAVVLRAASALQSSMEPWELDYLNHVDWELLTADAFFRDPVARKMMRTVIPIFNETYASRRPPRRMTFGVAMAQPTPGCSRQRETYAAARNVILAALVEATGSTVLAAVCLGAIPTTGGLSTPQSAVCVAAAGYAIWDGVLDLYRVGGRLALASAVDLFASDACASEGPCSDPASCCRQLGGSLVAGRCVRDSDASTPTDAADDAGEMPDAGGDAGGDGGGDGGDGGPLPSMCSGAMPYQTTVDHCYRQRYDSEWGIGAYDPPMFCRFEGTDVDRTGTDTSYCGTIWHGRYACVPGFRSVRCVNACDDAACAAVLMEGCTTWLDTAGPGWPADAGPQCPWPPPGYM